MMFFKKKIFSSSKEKCENEVMNATWATTKRFAPKINSSTFVKVIKVYDGDTITIVAKPYKDQEVCRFSVRLSGIDTPEIKGGTALEKSAALYVQSKLSVLLLEKIIEIDCVNHDKYGRLLADVWIKDLHVNKWLLDMNYAVPYDGKKKEKISDEFLNNIIWREKYNLLQIS
jgi:endonuclease YncB( thermonuclease family)